MWFKYYFRLDSHFSVSHIFRVFFFDTISNLQHYTRSAVDYRIEHPGSQIRAHGCPLSIHMCVKNSKLKVAYNIYFSVCTICIELRFDLQRILSQRYITHMPSWTMYNIIYNKTLGRYYIHNYNTNGSG